MMQHYIVLHNIFMFFLLYCTLQSLVVLLIIKHYYGRTLSVKSFLILTLVPIVLPEMIRIYKPYGYRNVPMFKYKQTVLEEKQQSDKERKERDYNKSISKLTRKYND